jgi:carbon-monoxide dehydrogenase medium subunit
VKPAPFSYESPRSVEEAVALLGEHGDEAKVLAGGQSLVPLLNMRLALPSVVIDIGRVVGLRETSSTATGVRYGAGVTHAAVEDRRVPDPVGGLLHHVAGGIGYRAVRNKGTMGGSLAHADASAEWPVVLSAVGATVEARSVRGSRTIPVASLVEGYFSNTLEDDELLVAIDVPSSSARWGFSKIARKPGEFAESLAVARVNGSAEVWLGAAREVPVRVPLDGLDAVAAQVEAVLDPEDRYKRHLHGVAASRAVRHALEGS